MLQGLCMRYSGSRSQNHQESRGQVHHLCKQRYQVFHTISPVGALSLVQLASFYHSSTLSSSMPLPKNLRSTTSNASGLSPVRREQPLPLSAYRRKESFLTVQKGSGDRDIRCNRLSNILLIPNKSSFRSGKSNSLGSSDASSKHLSICSIQTRRNIYRQNWLFRVIYQPEYQVNS